MREKKSWKRLMAAAMSVVLLLPAPMVYAEEGQKAKQAEAAVEEAVAYAESRAVDADGLVIEDGVLTGYTGTAVDVVIPDTVTRIGSWAFSSCSILENVTIPESVTSIGSYAFSYCLSLKSVTIPGSVTVIENDTFYECRGLESVTIGKGVTSIGSQAFIYCESLKSVTIPEGVVSIGELAFSDCWNLESVTIPESVEEIGFAVFNDCNNLTIYGKPGSHAQSYAKEYNIKFVSTEESTKPSETPEETTAALSLNETNVTLYTGKAFNSVTITPTVTGVSTAVTWKSSEPGVAKVKDGKITAVKKGTAKITATANGISKSVEVTVKNPALTIKNGSKKFTKSKLTVKKKKKMVLAVTVSPKNSGISISKLTAKQKKIATVTLKKGKITIKGKKKGSFTLQIKSGKAAKKIKITVK